MKSSICTLVLLVLISCNSERNNPKKAPETPKALEEKTASYEIISKRGSEDLLEDLYQELANKTPDLKALDKEIDDLNKCKYDSSHLFNAFNNKNETYYNIANGRLSEGIKDSLLRSKMRLLITSSLKKYTTSIAKHTALLNAIDSSSTTLNDLHTVLKITKTLPIIEQYQQQNLPNSKSLEGYLQQQQKVIKKVEVNLKK
jgi:hypothetical protein